MRVQQILKGNTRVSVKKLKLKGGWLLKRDNGPKNTLKSTMDHLRRHQSKVLSCSSQSSELNITGNLWINLRGT